LLAGKMPGCLETTSPIERSQHPQRMPLSVIGVNHKLAPVSIRERIAVSTQDTVAVARTLCEHEGVQGAIVLSTCNRTEIYVDSTENVDLSPWFSDQARKKGFNLAFDQHGFKLYGQTAVSHLFRVASGLDSLVLGEPQILGQLKFAFQASRDNKLLTPLLHRWAQDALKSAKEVRSGTAIGEASVSFAGAAVRLGKQLHGSLERCSLLLIGAGEMTRLFGKHFKSHGVTNLTVANRTEENGRTLARELGGVFCDLQSAIGSLERFDLIVTATAAPFQIIGKGTVERALRVRRGHPFFMVDMAVPRDIEPEVSALSDVYLYTVDDLGKISQQGSTSRAAAASEAEELVGEHVAQFMRWLESRSTKPLIQELQSRARQYQNEALDRAQRQLERGDDPSEVAEELARSLTNKLLHHPMQAIKDQPERAEELSKAIDLLYPRSEGANE
jgi:glutamyl-tRNA reductase